MAHAALGMGGILLLAWLLSEDRRAIPWRTVLGGVALQIGLAAVLLGVPGAQAPMRWLGQGAAALHDATQAGAVFVFGYLAGPPAAFAETRPGASFILAFQALPMVLTIGALAALLFHWGVLQRIVAGFAFLLRRGLGVDGPLALGAAVHVFVGMVEAPLLIRPYLMRLSRGELFALMSCGLAGVAGTVMAIYATFLADVLSNAFGHILVASAISTPAALAVSALMIPFAPSARDGDAALDKGDASGALDALARGTMDAIPILAGIVAMLIVAVASVNLIDAALGLLPDIGGAPLSLRRGFALPFRPVAWVLGVPWAETAAAADLLATKTVLNEFVAYLDFSRLPPETFGPGSRAILAYALCGFANFGSVGILVGGLGAMAPGRRREVAELGLRAMLAGTMATCMSGAVAGAALG
jgi:CNT family concentrative nucleoside transporter